MNIIESEQGNVVYVSENETTFLTIFTLTCSSVGIGLSAVALTLLFLTAILFAEWRQNYKNQLLVQFMTARFLYTIVRYFYDVRNAFNLGNIDRDYVIHLDIFLMVYTETILLSWMFIFSKQMYESFVKVFIVECPNIWKVSLLAWSVPGVVSLVLHLLFHIQRHDLKYFAFYLIFLKWPVLAANAVLLCLVLKSILKSNKSNSEQNPRIVLVIIALIFIFCFQQVFLDSYKIVYVAVLHNYIKSSFVLLFSNILSLYHCAFSICFWVFGNQNTRKLWKYRCKMVTAKRPFIQFQVSME